MIRYTIMECLSILFSCILMVLNQPYPATMLLLWAIYW